MNHDLSPPSSAVWANALVFSGGELYNEDERDVLKNVDSALVLGSSTRSEKEQNVSVYVRVFEDMVSTVITEETHLLNDEEFALLTVFAHLSYNARFLMVKLLLRKQDTWHRLDALKYEDELGSISAIQDAIDELCKVAPKSSDIIKEEPEEQGITTPTMGEMQVTQEKPESDSACAPEFSSEDRPIALARSEREMDLYSLLECLRLDELKAVARQFKLKPKGNQKKNELIRDLLDSSSSQATLTGFMSKDGVKPSEDRCCHQTRPSSSKLGSQQDRLKQMVLGYIVKCIRVDEEFFGIIHRVNLVYFRMTMYTPGILVTALLTRFGKRAYPGYDAERTKNVWPTRQALLDYEEVLILEGQVDTLLAGNGPLLGSRPIGSTTPAPRFSSAQFVIPRSKSSQKEGKNVGVEESAHDVKPDHIRVRGARIVKDIFEQEYPRWQDLVKTKAEECGQPIGLQRFHYGHVLTRIIHKCSAAFGILGEYERELEVLEALLSQKIWRRGQRGRWHERRALILSTHLPKDEETIQRALDAVIDALLDPDTHIVFRPKLERRLRRLENKLKIPIQERHTCEGTLVDADETIFEAVRLKHRAASLKLDQIGRCIDAGVPQQRDQDIKRYYSPVVSPTKARVDSSGVPVRTKPLADIPKGKSRWLGLDGKELTVEELALQRYESQGFKGVHCETRVITMLFSLLFWDIIFKPIPGAFETPYQTAPLDIAEDSFYHARKDLMEVRLAAVEAGKGVDFVRRADANNRASETWCVGVQWDLFSSEDLVDIVTCIGGKALSVICRVLCEDYTFGRSGGPDLFLWNAERGTCKFVEVKGPGDSLQENQRIWIDILLKAPVAVEICRVVESGNESDRPKMRTPKSSRRKAKKGRQKEETPADSGDADALPIIVDDLYEQPAATSVGPLSGPASLRGSASPGFTIASFTPTRGTPSPLKRMAPEEVVSPTPFKRLKSS